MADQALSNTFYKNLIVLGTIICGVLYVEKSMKTTVKDTMAPYVEQSIEIKKKIEVQSTEINALKTKSDLNDYKWNIYETQIRNFIKPDEIEVRPKEVDVKSKD